MGMMNHVGCGFFAITMGLKNKWDSHPLARYTRDAMSAMKGAGYDL